MWRDDAYLLDILLAAKRSREFVSDISREDFERSTLHQHAVMKTLEVIGEAARKISQEKRQSHPEIPWAQLIGMRNRLIHEYF